MKANPGSIAIIGHFGFGHNCYDGQTIKTMTIYKGLKRKIGRNIRIRCIDTYNRDRPVELAVKSLVALFDSDNIIIMLSRNGLQIYLPLLFWVSKIRKFRVLHCVIGGNDNELLGKNPRWKKYLNSFYVNWYESRKLTEEMKLLGVRNAQYLPNFKDLSRVQEKELCEISQSILHSAEYTFCTFSRVSEGKGITEAIKAIRFVRRQMPELDISLDIYGQVENSYKEEFFELVNMSSGTVRYMGIVESDDSVRFLKGYFSMLFPTHFYGEGFPGTLIDAMAAGVPVIASDWHMNSEIIEDGEDGIIYGRNKYRDLVAAMIWSICNKEEYIGFRHKWWRKSELYLADANLDTILAQLY